jgi:hypothetical protein
VRLYLQSNQSKKGWRGSLSGKAPAYQEQSLEYKLQCHHGKKRKKKGKRERKPKRLVIYICD